MNSSKPLAVLIFANLAVLLFIFWYTNSPPGGTQQRYYYLDTEKSIGCYKVRNREALQDISSYRVRKGKSIFFHETSCRSHRNGKIVILPRQACAVESAALMNPNLDVFLTFTSPGVIKSEGSESDRILSKLLDYRNVKILHLDFENYTRGTALEELYRRGDIDGSRHAQSHASDVLRYLTLFKYGGIYLDMDVVVVRTLEDLKMNYAGLESANGVAAGVLSFDHEGAGHAYAESCVRELQAHFSKTTWAGNGPGIIQRLMKQLCQSKVKMSKDNTCQNFTVYRSSAFYPVPYWKWGMYFDPHQTNEVLRMAKQSYVVHIWNKLDEHLKIHVEAETAYTHYARQFCPKVFAECRSLF